MSVIKPGKLGIGGAKQTAERKKALAKAREIWDDYAIKTTKKREYEKGAGNRMVPKSAVKEPRESLFKEKAEGELGEEGEKQEPRNDYEALEERLQFTFKDRSLIGRALTHRSALG